MTGLSKSDLKRKSKNELVRLVLDQSKRIANFAQSNPDNGLLSFKEASQLAELAYKRGAAETLEAIDIQLKNQIAGIEEEQPHD